MYTLLLVPSVNQVKFIPVEVDMQQRSYKTNEHLYWQNNRWLLSGSFMFVERIWWERPFLLAVFDLNTLSKPAQQGTSAHMTLTSWMHLKPA